jgi:outer membrane scaffolding protein for murein synthesis (MipA/OmpV family)
MNNFLRVVGFSGMAWLASVASVQAQPSSLPLWEVGAFAGGVSTPAYPAASERATRVLALPFFIYRGEVLRADRGGLGARVINTDNFEFDIGFAASLPASSQDIAVRQGMPDLGTLLEFGPRMKITLARPAPGSRLRLDLPLRSVLEINGGVRGQGWAFEPEITYETRDIGAGWSGSASASLVLGDRALNQYFYGVAQPYATAARPVFDAQAGLITTRLGVATSKALGPDLRFFGFARHDLYTGSANQSSPLFRQSNGTSVGAGLTWTFGRSEQRAKD